MTPAKKSAPRQAALRARREAAGLKQRVFFATDSQWAEVLALLKRLQDDAAGPDVGVYGRGDLMALAAVRYCLGRTSYIVGDCCDWLPTVWPRLAPNARSVIVRDIEEAVRRDTEARARGDEHLPLGMDYDRACWVGALRLLQGQGGQSG